ncbi:hypothetical protein SLS55_003920 [Diplodia seriata]|uniref:Uncharacterized protein n=1 Tax=Diplodia seriata TaxID=420778 RepID=A0ABR3CJ47_9PEZI
MGLSTSWTPLVVDPCSIFNVEEDEGFMRGIRAPKREERQQVRRTDFFKARLMQIALVYITKERQDSIRSIDDVCAAFEKDTRERMEDTSYWRGVVDGTLIQVHKLSRSLGILGQSIRNVVEDRENVHMDYGVWT